MDNVIRVNAAGVTTRGLSPPNAQAKLRGLRYFGRAAVSFSLWLGSAD